MKKKPRLRINPYWTPDGYRASFQEWLIDERMWSNHFWDIDSYFSWYYN